MGEILTKARRDWLRHSTKGGFNTTLNFTAPTSETATIEGLAMKHHVTLDSEGSIMSARNAHATFSETDLIALGYPVRMNNEVTLTGHIIDYVDSTGQTMKYRITQTYPDETVGVIYCTLEMYKE